MPVNIPQCDIPSGTYWVSAGAWYKDFGYGMWLWSKPKGNIPGVCYKLYEVELNQWNLAPSVNVLGWSFPLNNLDCTLVDDLVHIHYCIHAEDKQPIAQNKIINPGLYIDDCDVYLKTKFGYNLYIGSVFDNLNRMILKVQRINHLPSTLYPVQIKLSMNKGAL